MADILVVYDYANIYPLRPSNADRLYSFRRHGAHRCAYLNVAMRRVPSYLKKIKFDLIVFDTIFLGTRWSRPYFEELMRQVRELKELKAVKVVLPQDEFLNPDLLCEFINEFGIDLVFSVAPESEWPVIYPNVDRAKVKFVHVLTGYLADTTVARINRLAAANKQRTIDIGYRALHEKEWLGRHGFLKSQICDVFAEHAPRKGLVADVSTRREDTFFGDAWFEFLLRCKYTIGVEGGATVLDRDGQIRQKSEAYIRAHPQADFEEIEANCFPGQDGLLKLLALSPRHLEACVTRTCQVLIEGKYNGVLQPDQHFIELKRDFSNLEQVLDMIKRDTHRQEITERAYRDVVQSGRYTYKSFVDRVVTASLAGAAEASRDEAGRAGPILHAWMIMADKLSWTAVILNWYIIAPVRLRLRRALVTLFSEERVAGTLRRLRKS